MSGPTPEQEKLINQYLDPNGVIEVPKPLLDVMTPREIATVDQLLAARFDIARLFGRGKTALATQVTIRNIVTLDMMLSQARTRVKEQ